MKKQNKAPQRSRAVNRTSKPVLGIHGAVDTEEEISVHGGPGSGNFGHGGRPGERGGSSSGGGSGANSSDYDEEDSDESEMTAEDEKHNTGAQKARDSDYRVGDSVSIGKSYGGGRGVVVGFDRDGSYAKVKVKGKVKTFHNTDVVSNGRSSEDFTTHLESFTCNVRAKLVRNDTMEGKTYKVVPMVMMVVGVHAGSQGPLYYPKSELSKTPEAWNHKPVVVYHPTMNGRGVSACSPDVLTSHKIGVIMNTKFDTLGRLVAEAWLDPDRIEKVDPRVGKAVDKLSTLECSTGMFMEVEATEGKFEGEEYKGVARNYRPDHLAVLPDKVGACSVADGAGFIRNEESEEEPTTHGGPGSGNFGHGGRPGERGGSGGGGGGSSVEQSRSKESARDLYDAAKSAGNKAHEASQYGASNKKEAHEKAASLYRKAAGKYKEAGDSGKQAMAEKHARIHERFVIRYTRNEAGEDEEEFVDNGGPGSGNFGHAGRPGERGGSGGGGSGRDNPTETGFKYGSGRPTSGAKVLTKTEVKAASVEVGAAAAEAEKFAAKMERKGDKQTASAYQSDAEAYRSIAVDIRAGDFKSAARTYSFMDTAARDNLVGKHKGTKVGGHLSNILGFEYLEDHTFNGLGLNEQSFESIRSNLDKALQERFKPTVRSNINNPSPYDYSIYTIAVYSDFVVFSDKGKLFKLSYTSTDTKVELSEDDPVEVVRVTEFRTVDGAFVGNTATITNNSQQNQIEEISTMNKKAIVDGMITNGGWDESDREFLMACNEAQLDKMGKKMDEEEEEEEDTKAKKKAPVANSVEEFIGSAPAEMQDVLRSGLAAHQAQKTGLVDTIVANASNKFTKEQLNAMPLGQLEAIAALAKTPAAAAPTNNQSKPNYAGQGGQAAPTTNETKQEVLTAPTINWAKK